MKMVMVKVMEVSRKCKEWWGRSCNDDDDDVDVELMMQRKCGGEIMMVMK